MKYREHAARNRRTKRRSAAGGILAVAVLALAGAGWYAVSAGVLRLPHAGRAPALPMIEAPKPPAAPELPPTALYAGTRTVPVIMYHDVTDHPSIYFDVRTDEFRQQMKLLKRADAH